MVAEKDLMEVLPSCMLCISLHAGLLCNNMFYLLQYWNTTVLTRCLEMVDVQFIIIFDAVGVNQTLDHAAKTHIHTPIAVEGQSLE